jgi:hypothetical protein
MHLCVCVCAGGGVDFTQRQAPFIKRSNFSNATTPAMFQASMDLDLEKRSGRTFGCVWGRGGWVGGGGGKIGGGRVQCVVAFLLAQSACSVLAA